MFPSTASRSKPLAWKSVVSHPFSHRFSKSISHSDSGKHIPKLRGPAVTTSALPIVDASHPFSHRFSKSISRSNSGKHIPKLRGPAVTTSALPIVDAIVETASSSIFQSAMGASFKLLVMCAVVMVMMARRILPEDTPQVLSKVCFNLFIPCTLFVKTAQILSVNKSWALFSIPLAGTFQIIIGALLGLILIQVLFRPTKSESQIATATATAIGIPSLAPALLPRSKGHPAGSKELLLLACAFNNSLTLPLIFILSLFTGEAATKVSAYVALYLCGWSPLLWGAGYAILSGLDPALKTKKATADALRLSGEFSDRGQGSPSTSTSTSAAADAAADAAQEKREKVQRFLKQVFNPPMIAILCGVAVGMVPNSAVVMLPHAPGSDLFMHSAPAGIASAVSVLRSLVEVLDIFGSATLGVQAAVLASSLYHKPAEDPRPALATAAASPVIGLPATLSDLPTAKFPFPDANPEVLVEAEAYTMTNSKALQTSSAKKKPGFLSMFVPEEPIDRTITAVTLAVRMTVVPAATYLLVQGMTALGLLPADPLATFAILLQASMPTAQNLVLLCQLRDFTQPLAERTARILLIQYTLSIPFITFWIGTWFKVLGISV